MNKPLNYKNDVGTVLNTVLERIRPRRDELERAYAVYEELKAVIEESIDINVEYNVSLEGSLAKGTCISSEIDLDIFILVRKRDMNNEWIEHNIINKLVKALNKYGIKTERRYASHPYIRAEHRGVTADIVPAYWAKSIDEIITPVDRTPFHTKYVISKLSERQKDEVRLLKKFLKAIGIYGAEIRVEGFSGYLCELLIIKYGTFINTLKNAAKWRPKKVILIEQHNDIDAGELRKLFPNAVLIVPDPVDPRRNVAAAVSLKSLSTMCIASSLFLKYPATSFFFPRIKELSYEEISDVVKKQGRSIVLCVFQTKDNYVSPDVVWGELKRALRGLINTLVSAGFDIYDCRAWSDERRYALILVETSTSHLPKLEIRRGPPPHLASNVLNFYVKNLQRGNILGPWINENGEVVVLKPRRTQALLEHVISYIKSIKMKSLEFTKALEISSVKSLPAEVLTNKEFRYWLTEAVLKTPAWVPSDMLGA